jgi:pantoate--beta-alanine ligase
MTDPAPRTPALARTPDDLRPFHEGVLVPTMGALHEGHAALIRRARAEADAIDAPVVVSVFVNPAQFNERADFERYPRSLDNDLASAAGAGADVVFAPSVGTVYPEGLDPPAEPPLPPVAEGPALEDLHRPGHFAGVRRVVARLFELTRPRAALFGEKDWQQLMLVRAMRATHDLGVRIIPVPTVREPDDVALSSRNLLLDEDARARAAAIPRALRAAASEQTPAAAEHAMRAALAAERLDIEYAVVRDAESLGPPRPGRPARALIAARAGGVRLIDNAPWGAGEPVV